MNSARLDDANLSRAYLIDASLKKASLKNAYLKAADLLNADFTGSTGMTCEQLKQVFFEETTLFPDYLKVTWNETGAYQCEILESKVNKSKKK